MKGRIIGIGLFICLVLPIAGTYIWLRHKKELVRKEVKQKIIGGVNKDQLVLLEFSIKETLKLLNWKHSQEFEYNNQMYDIVEFEFSGDSIKYWCWSDHKESKLNKQLNDLITNVMDSNQQHKNNQKRLSNFFKSLYFSNTTNWNLVVSETKQAICSYISIYKQNSLSPSVPPPELA